MALDWTTRTLPAAVGPAAGGYPALVRGLMETYFLEGERAATHSPAETAGMSR